GRQRARPGHRPRSRPGPRRRHRSRQPARRWRGGVVPPTRPRRLIGGCETAAVPVRRVLTLVLSGAVAGTALIGCGGGGGKIRTVTVTGTEMRFDPAQLPLAPGRYR